MWGHRTSKQARKAPNPFPLELYLHTMSAAMMRTARTSRTASSVTAKGATASVPRPVLRAGRVAEKAVCRAAAEVAAPAATAGTERDLSFR